MSKQALGSIPTFDAMERKTEDLDIFNEPKNDQEQPKEDLRKKLLNEMKKERETFKKEKETQKEQTIEEMQEEVKKLSRPLEETTTTKVTTKANEQKPSTQRDVRKGYIRQTFVISNENLELIRALSSYQEIKQVDLLEAILERGLADISEDTKEQALKHFRKLQNATNDEKKKIDNLFK